MYDVTVERTTECPIAVVKADTTWREFPALWPTMRFAPGAPRTAASSPVSPGRSTATPTLGLATST